MNKKVVQKLNNLPKDPGVYLYRNKDKRVIYVGKAINLKNRVSSYFKENVADIKTRKLVENITDLEWIICGSEIEALLLESELIKRYKPRYNIDWKDDKNYCYIRVTNEDYPKVMVTRQIVDDKSQYFGPFVDSGAVRSSLKILRRIFPYCTCGLPSDRVCLYYHLGLCLGHGEKYVSKEDYKAVINNLMEYLSGHKEKIIKSLRLEMKGFAKERDFERAAQARDKIMALEKIRTIRVENQRDLNRDKAMSGLRQALNLKSIPRRIECYDISNINGQFPVGSMIVFEEGVPKKNDYRRFEIKTVKQIDDFAMLKEVLRRRFSHMGFGRDKSFREIPDLIIIDGGKGQLSSVQEATKDFEIKVSIVGLAKKEEEIFLLDPVGRFQRIVFPNESEVRFLLQRIRDEAHRFAITYHRNLRSKSLTASSLDTIPGVGAISKKKLLKKFVTIKRIKEASLNDLQSVVGKRTAESIKKNL